MDEPRTRTFEVDLAAAGLSRRKDFMHAVGYLSKMSCARYDGSRKVWVLTVTDGAAPEDYWQWEYLSRAGITYTETTAERA